VLGFWGFGEQIHLTFAFVGSGRGGGQGFSTMNKQPHPTNCIACGLELHGKEVTKADVAFMEKLNQAEKEFESRII